MSLNKENYDDPDKAHEAFTIFCRSHRRQVEDREECSPNCPCKYSHFQCFIVWLFKEENKESKTETPREVLAEMETFGNRELADNRPIKGECVGLILLQFARRFKEALERDAKENS